MPSALLVRFRPAGPWRLGPQNGDKSSTERVFSSDSLFAALTLAMRDLGWLEPWLAATAESDTPQVRVSSCFPYTGQTLLVQPPRSVWPPDGGGKVRWKAARFVPVSVIPFLLRGDSLNEDQWAVDPVSEALVPLYRSGPAPPPFRISRRKLGAVDRVDGTSRGADTVACLEFPRGSGMWFLATFEDEVWNERLRAAVRLLADSGIGGGRSRGWGRSVKPEVRLVEMPGFLIGDVSVDAGETGWWMLSLFSPSDKDGVDWSRGNYCTAVRAGRVQDSGELKAPARMVMEGSVLLCGNPPVGTARNVATAEHPHPVYRSGIALAVQIPWQEGQRFSLSFDKEPEAKSAEVAPPVLPPPAVPEDAGEVEPAEPVATEPSAGGEGEAVSEQGEVQPGAVTAEAEFIAPEAVPEQNQQAPEEPTAGEETPVEEPPEPSEPPAQEPPGTEEPPVGEPGPEPPPEKVE